MKKSQVFNLAFFLAQTYHEDSINGMVMKGFFITTRLTHGFFWLMAHLLPKPLHKALFTKLHVSYEKKLITRLMKKGEGKAYSIDKVEDLSPWQFFFRYYLTNRPVVFKGLAKDWECTRWTLDSLVDQFGEDETVITGHGDMKPQSLASSIEQIKAGTIKNARVSNLLQANKKLRASIPFDSLKKFIPLGSFITSHQFFVGGKSNFTPLHAGLSNNFSVQIHGDKRWKIISTKLNPVVKPIVDGGPLLKSSLGLSENEVSHDEWVKYLDYYDVTLEPGDVLFNPSFFWHYIEYESESLTVGLRWINLYSTARSSILMAFLVLTAYNPSAFESFYKIRKSIPMPFYR